MRWKITKGRITLVITVLIMVVALFLSGDLRLFLFIVGTNAFVGYATNAVAIRMLFDYLYLLPWKKKWPMPCSGILEEKRVEVASGIGWVVAQRLLSPPTILGNIRSQSFQQVVNDIVTDNFKEISNDPVLMTNLVNELEKSLIAFTDSDIFREKLQYVFYRVNHLQKLFGNANSNHSRDTIAARFLNKVKSKIVSEFCEREKFTPHLQEEMKKVVTHICADSVFHETLQKFVENALQRVIASQSPLKCDIKRHGNLIVQEIIEKIDLEKMVADEVCAFPPGVLRDLMYRITADNLEWLEVWGGILGGLSGIIFWAIVKFV